MVKWIFTGASTEIGTNKKVPFTITLKNEEKADVEGEFDLSLQIKEKNDEIEWFLVEEQKKGRQVAMSPKTPDVLKVHFKLKEGAENEFQFSLETPKGADLGDEATVKLKINGTESELFSVKIRQTIIVVKTTIGQELKIARDIGLKAEIDNHEYIYSVLVPADVKGYIFIETLYPDRTMALLRSVRGARNMIAGEVQISEIENYLVSKPAIEALGVGNYVEVIEGPFKGEKARITHIDTSRDEITLELQNAIVPIPLTVKADSVKLLEKEV
ncbi:MAG: transcription elongation factor Spt5 [Thermoplasmatales archaeon]